MLSRILIALVSPLGTALVLGTLACVLGARRKRAAALALAAGALAWLCLWSLPAASLALRARLEAAYPPAPIASLPSAQAIVVLGGALSPPRHGQLAPDLGAGVDRVWHAARLYHAGKAPLLTLSGAADPQENTMSEAAAMRELLRDLGVPDQAMLLEEKSRNTAENAKLTAAVLLGRGAKAILLVTSAVHMQRARRQFEAAGLKVEPAATDHEATGKLNLAQLTYWLPDAGALEGSASAMKEIVANAVR